jgi:hypothetical protein
MAGVPKAKSICAPAGQALSQDTTMIMQIRKITMYREERRDPNELDNDTHSDLPV